MSTTSKYIVLSSDEDVFLDLGFDFSDLSLSGESIEFRGSAAVDSILLRPGVEVDFTQTGSGQDKVYLQGVWGDYKDNLSFPDGESGFVLELQRTIDAETEKVVLRRGFTPAISDLLVFGDGVIDARTMVAEKDLAVPDPSNETSLNKDIPETLSGRVKMIAFNNQGVVFASVANGMSQEVLGSAGIDVVYVGEGGQSDATALGSSSDVVYLRGGFSEYAKDVDSFGIIKLSRDHDQNALTPDEVVTVSASFGGNDDQIVFADGAIASTRSLRSILANAADPDAVTVTELGSLWDNSTVTPGVSTAPSVISFGVASPDDSYVTGETIVIVATMSEEVAAGATFDVVLDSGATVTLTAASEGTELNGNYVIGENDLSSDLTVVSYTTGNVLDLDGNPMVSTALPPDASNIAANHAIVVNGLALESAVHGVTELDVRSDIVISAAGDSEDIGFTDVAGTYELRLVQQADAGLKTGFAGEAADGGQTIQVTIDDQGAVSLAGGSISFVNGRAVVDFDDDLDLSNNFTLEIDAGLFVGQSSGAASTSAEGNSIAFSTVTPTADGTVSQAWGGAAIIAGDTWFDGTGGNYVGNETTVVPDLAGLAGIVVIGRDGDASDGITLAETARAALTNFGSDDHIYIDRDVAEVANLISEETVSFSSVDGGVPTILLFAADNAQAAVFITFENDTDTPDVDESELVASAFSASQLAENSPDLSFEDILGFGVSPVIGG